MLEFLASAIIGSPIVLSCHWAPLGCGISTEVELNTCLIRRSKVHWYDWAKFAYRG